MYTRQEMKLLARERFKEQWFTVICSSLLLLGVIFVFILLRLDPKSGDIRGMIAYCLGWLLCTTINGFYLKVYRGEAVKPEYIFEGLFQNILKKLWCFVLHTLFVVLHSLLFLIPGIIKTYAYIFTPFILSEFPDVSARDALRISERLTHGYKMRIFNLWISFFLWEILSLVTFGILSVVAIPYYGITLAGFFSEILNDKLQTGEITYAELGVEKLDNDELHDEELDDELYDEELYN